MAIFLLMVLPCLSLLLGLVAYASYREDKGL